jgi:hypothetical protein
VRVSAGHFVGGSGPPYYGVLVASTPIALVTPSDLASVTLYSIQQFPRGQYDMPWMISRWSDGMICLDAPEEKS